MAKRFDFESNKGRMIESLRKKEEWALILNNGTVGNLIDVIAEARAEDARYMEYLLGEKKWKTAMNMSSLMHQADLLSYKRQLPKSAIGYVIVSHKDVNGNDRLSNYGKTFFDINIKSNYDDIEEDKKASPIEKQALVPWVCDVQYEIKEGTVFRAANGTEFFSTETVSSRALKKPFSQMSIAEKEDFLEKGGWNGIKYVRVPIMQGIKKHISIGRSNSSERFQSFILPTLDVDNASNEISSRFFSVEIIQDESKDPILFNEIPKLSMATPLDYVFEKSILNDESGIKIKFGDGINGIIPPEGTVYINYVETLGKAGNVDEELSITEMNYGGIVDPRNNLPSFLSCLNTAPVLGGRDIEEIDEFRVNAPTSYLKSYTISTEDAYNNFIKQRSPLDLLHFKIYPENGLLSHKDSLNNVINVNINRKETSVIQEINEHSNHLNITALLSNGEKIADPESQFLRPLELSMNEIKSPTDSFNFIQPNLIELSIGLTVHTSSSKYSKSDISYFSKDILKMNYDIFHQDFNEPIYYSEILSLIQNYKFCKSSSALIEAVASVDYDNIIRRTYNINNSENTEKSISSILIHFSFDDIFNSNKILKGFKNWEDNTDYLLKADISFINKPSEINKNRTIFLLDNRTDNSPIFQNKFVLIDNTQIENYISPGVDNYFIPSPDSARMQTKTKVSQFQYLTRITNSNFMSVLRDFSKSPSENLPYATDLKGDYMGYDSVNNTEEYENKGGIYFKKNKDYVLGIDIDFNPETLEGTLFLPVSNYLDSLIGGVDEDQEKISSILKQFLNIRIYAQPRMIDFMPSEPNEIIFIDQNYIKVETETN